MKRWMQSMIAVALAAWSAMSLNAAEAMEKKDGAQERATPQICVKCGEIKGADACCKAEGREKCDKCGLFKGSPGCCKLPKDAKPPVNLCQKCGEIKGTDACCKAEGREKCDKCGLFKGSPGCCKLPKDDKSSEKTEHPKGDKKPKAEHPEHPK